jgi:hypothetical protein
MFHITSGLVGGLAAIATWALVAPSPDPASNAWGSAGDTAVNRAAKADRVATPRVYRGDDDAVATVEVVGIRDTAIVYRDRAGRVLFQTDPLRNVTVVSKGSVLPQLTVRETSRSTPAPVEAPRQVRPTIPVGCEPLASPIAQPNLSHLTGRCLS